MSVCKKCGFDLPEDKTFCPNCGVEIKEAAAIEAAPQTFAFFKQNMLGNLTYKRTSTEITVSDNQIQMKQTLDRFFRKDRITEKSFPVSSVVSVRTHTVMDFWDTLYAIVFGILGFFQPAAFLIALVCLWCAHGREMELTLSNSEKIKIPFAGAKEEAEKMIKICGK